VSTNDEDQIDGAAGGPGRQSYLSVCAIFLNEAPYLREWIEFHRLVGVERFYLYDHGSDDGGARILEPYVEEGTVVLHDWRHLFPRGQMPAYDHSLSEYAGDSRWIAFIDLDEFLFSPTGRLLSDVLTEFEEFPAVAVNWAVFGTSGHRVRPAGLVIESYLSRAKSFRRTYKNIVDPRRAVRCRDPHHFVYREGEVPVDERKQPVTEWQREVATLDVLRINHYHTKSEEELRRKWATPQATDGELRPQERIEKTELFNAVKDETILAYLPGLRRALAGPPGAPAATEARR
jgi:hypothetical protein